MNAIHIFGGSTVVKPIKAMQTIGYPPFSSREASVEVLPDRQDYRPLRKLPTLFDFGMGLVVVRNYRLKTEVSIQTTRP